MTISNPRRRRFQAWVLPGFLGLVAFPALADNYPFSGLFWPAFETVDKTDLDRRCALTFLEQKADGTWTSYHADLDRFRTTGEIRYLTMAQGACQFTPQTKVETCLVTLDHSYPELEGATFYDVILALADDKVETVMIEAASGWETVMQDAGSSDAGIAMNYLRCPFSPEALTSRISPEATTLSADALNALRNPSDELLVSPEVSRLVQVLRGE